MFRINVYISDGDITFLRNLKELRLSEHVRRALDDYIQKLQALNISTSASKLKKGEQNG